MDARVMVLGGGGREHALAWALARSKHVAELVAVPGNPGIAQLARTLDDPGDVRALAAMAVAERIDLVVVGPEAPLAAGVADAVLEAGIPTFGPPAAAARLEASKSFAKAFMARHGIPTAPYASFTDPAAARAHLHRAGLPTVVKASGLAAGKGVTLAYDHATAERAIDDVFAAGHGEVVLEGLLEGQEVSLLVVCDGDAAVALPLAQDYKQALDGDRGPMTGGMGAVAPVDLLDEGGVADVMARVVEPTLAGLRSEGTPMRGTLFVGLMLTEAGPMVLEYNVRFGDPEAQAVLPLLASDAFELLYAAATGRLARVTPSWHAGACACVVLAAPGYPGTPRTGAALHVPDDLGEHVLVFHAGTALADGRLVAAGGRVLGVTARGADRSEAVRRAYEAVDRIDFPEAALRRDIGARPSRR